MTGARVLLGAGAGLVLATLAIGFLHTPEGRPWLRAFTGACPVGFGADLSVEQRDAAHVRALSTVRGSAPAAARPALGFELDRTTRAELDAWVAERGLACTEKGTTRTCPGLPADTIAEHPAGEVAFQLDAHDRLVAVTWETTALPAPAALALQVRAEAGLAAALGPPEMVRGETAPDWLLASRLRQRAAEHRFTDYRAQVVTTHLAEGRVKVREVYQSIPEG